MSKAFLFLGVKDMYLCLVLGVRSWRKKESFIVFVNFIFKSTCLEKNILRITLKGTHKWYECSLHLGVCLLLIYNKFMLSTYIPYTCLWHPNVVNRWPFWWSRARLPLTFCYKKTLIFNRSIQLISKITVMSFTDFMYGD